MYICNSCSKFFHAKNSPCHLVTLQFFVQSTNGVVYLQKGCQWLKPFGSSGIWITPDTTEREISGVSFLIKPPAPNFMHFLFTTFRGNFPAIVYQICTFFDSPTKNGFLSFDPFMDVSEKIWVFPPNHPLKNRVFHYFHHPFWGVPLIFGNTFILKEEKIPPSTSSHGKFPTSSASAASTSSGTGKPR